MKRPPVLDRLRAGLRQGVQFARGELSLRTVEVPAPAPVLRAADLVRLRRRLNVSQEELAHLLNVTPKTVQSWEQGARRPSRVALQLLQILRARPEVVCQVAGVRGTRAAPG
jgi:putative transcriptional regulator